MPKKFTLLRLSLLTVLLIALTFLNVREDLRRGVRHEKGVCGCAQEPDASIHAMLLCTAR